MELKYLGITPYDENNSSEFTGRTEETWTLYDRIIRNDYTVYYAASGEGKSSLIRAGLLPILRRRNFFPVYIVFEDIELSNSFSLEDVVLDRIKKEEIKHGVSFEQANWSEQLYNDRQDLLNVLRNNFWWKLRNYTFKCGETELKPLFIFDQFEEIFTKANYECTDSFFSQLEELSTDYIPQVLKEQIKSFGIDIPTQKNFKALFSFRTEYLGDLDYWCVEKYFLPSLQENRMCLKPLTLKGAKEIVSLDESLQIYSDQIIRGCAEPKANIHNDNQPCVYALILSVVCQTLCTVTDNERNILLDKLNKNQEETIDDILLKFYKGKLKDAGLDYIRDERIVAKIENALVDEKGRRSRRDTDESCMQPLSKWIEILSSKKNGLLKVIGNKEVKGNIVRTVEFPHDRLCKAIDTSRKERQGKISWKLNRQSEWIQFGIISAVIGAIALLWNSLMPTIKPVITWFIGRSNSEIFKSFKELLCGNNPELSEMLQSEGFISLCLMALMLLFIPLTITFIVRKSRRWQIISSVISGLGTFLFGLLWYKSWNIDFTDNYVPILTAIGFISNISCLIVSLLRLRMPITKLSYDTQFVSNSYWPLLGGYFIFVCYLFHEFLYRITFGISEPKDSFWVLFVLPILYIFWAFGFFCMRIKAINKKGLWGCLILIILSLSFLSIISYIPYYCSIKRSCGIALPTILIIIFIVSFSVIIWKAKSNTKFYFLSTKKRVLATILGIIVIMAAFFLNLGYNPFVISPSSVCHVSTWREVTIQNSDSVGIVYSTNGNVIIPCCIPMTEKIDSLLTNGKTLYQNGSITIGRDFENSVFKDKLESQNADGSLKWDSKRNRLTALIPVTPTLEEHLYNITKSNIYGKRGGLRDSIDYYAAKLFMEIRDANINFILNNEKYDSNTLVSLAILDSMQQKSLSYELKLLDSISTDDTFKRSYFKVLEDKDLVNFHSELSRSYLLCLIKDRANHLDMPSMFTLMRYYLIIFFADVPCMNMSFEFDSNTKVELDVKVEKGIIKHESFGNKRVMKICTDDILKERLFAGSEILNSLCEMDMAVNVKRLEGSVNTKLQGELTETFNNLSRIIGELKEMSQSRYEAIDKILKSGLSSELLMEKIINYLSASDPKRYEDILRDLDSVNFGLNEINRVAADSSFNSLKEKVLDTLLPQMKSNSIGIYNNDFENICKNFIQVSIYRGYDAEKDLGRLESYLEIKNGMYNVTKEINTSFKDAGVLKKDAGELLDSIKQEIKRFIDDLR